MKNTINSRQVHILYIGVGGQQGFGNTWQRVAYLWPLRENTKIFIVNFFVSSGLVKNILSYVELTCVWTVLVELIVHSETERRETDCKEQTSQNAASQQQL